MSRSDPIGGGPRYQPYLDGSPAPFRWRLGLRPLDLAEWIEIDADYDRDVGLKAAYSDAHPEVVTRWMPGVEAEAQEVLEALVTHLGAGDPERFGQIDIGPGDRHPLDAAGRLVQEDLLLLVQRGTELVCGGGSVCFPNRWDLASKVGRTMAEIHAPVALLNDQLGDPIDRALQRLSPARAFWRLGYGLIDTPELFQPAIRPPVPAVPASGYHLRVERETLRRMPRTGCVLFTIRTYLAPVTTLATGDAERLAEALAAMPDEVLDYKSLAGVRDAIVEHLRSARP